jgi:hypothetical protein
MTPIDLQRIEAIGINTRFASEVLGIRIDMESYANQTESVAPLKPHLTKIGRGGCLWRQPNTAELQLAQIQLSSVPHVSRVTAIAKTQPPRRTQHEAW